MSSLTNTDCTIVCQDFVKKRYSLSDSRSYSYALPPPHPELNKTNLYTTSTLNGDPKFLKNAPLSFYDTSCVYIFVSIWIRAHICSTTNRIEGEWLGTGREGRGTEAGKEGGRQRTRERDSISVGKG